MQGALLRPYWAPQPELSPEKASTTEGSDQWDPRAAYRIPPRLRPALQTPLSRRSVGKPERGVRREDLAVLGDPRGHGV